MVRVLEDELTTSARPQNGKGARGRLTNRPAVWVVIPLVMILIVALVALTVRSGSDNGEASLDVLSDRVERSGSGGDFLPVTAGDALTVGETLRTDRTGRAEVAYWDGALTRIDTNTTFTLQALEVTSERRAAETRLEVGSTWHRLRPLTGASDRFEVQTPNATATVRGTAFTVRCVRLPECTFTVLEGEIEVTGADGTVRLRAGQQVTVGPDGTLGEVITLTPDEFAADPWVTFNLERDLTAGYPWPVTVTAPDLATPAPTPTPAATPTPSPAASPTPAATWAPGTATTARATPTPAPQPAFAAQTEAPVTTTATPAPTPQPAPPPGPTPPPGATPTPAPTPAPTATPAPTPAPTATPAPTPAPTATPAPPLGGDTQRASVSSDGSVGNGASREPATSSDGRFVAFSSAASNFVDGDTNGDWDVFVRDRVAGTTERVSVSSDGEQGNAASIRPEISADGRFVVFASEATNLVPDDTNGMWDVFVHDRQSGVTERVSVSSSGAQANGHSSRFSYLSISADGRHIAFVSAASNLVDTATGGQLHVYVHDRDTATTELVSVSADGAAGNGWSDRPAISHGGRFVAFASEATNLVDRLFPQGSAQQVYVRDRQEGTTEVVSVSSDDELAECCPEGVAISGDGRFVAFISRGANLVPGDTNGHEDVFVHDRADGSTERVSVSSSGGQADGRSRGRPSISADGRFVAFTSEATNLVPGDTNGFTDIFVRDRDAGTTERVSVLSDGSQTNGRSAEPAISGNGAVVAFGSDADNLNRPRSPAGLDVYVRLRSV